jgi:uncharacterized protein (TIGR00369 family)
MKRQPNSRMCFVCGMQNPIGLKLIFEEEDGKVVARFTSKPEHQGFPGILHGGIISTLLDEGMGRAVFLLPEERWMLSAKIEIKYLRPIPIGEEITLVGEITQVHRRGVTCKGQLLLADGKVAAEGRGLYLDMPEEMKGPVREEEKYFKVIE